MKVASILSDVLKYSFMSPLIGVALVVFNATESLAFLVCFPFAKIGGKRVEACWLRVKKRWRSLFVSSFKINHGTLKSLEQQFKVIQVTFDGIPLLIIQLMIIQGQFDTPELMKSGTDLNQFGLQENETLQWLTSPATITRISIWLKIYHLVIYILTTMREALRLREYVGTYTLHKAIGFMDWYPSQHEKSVWNPCFQNRGPKYYFSE